MKRVVYSGLNIKCLLLTASIVEEHSYNEFTAKKTMEWFIKETVGNYFGMANANYQTMVSNINPILAESRPITHNGVDLYLNTYVVSYKLPDRMSREVVNLYLNRNMRNTRFPAEGEITYPKVGLFKCIAGDGSYTSKFINNSNIEYVDDWINWFAYQGQNYNKHNHAVLGISTDTIGYNKYLGVNNYYYGSLPQYQIEVAIYDNSADAINEKNGFWFKTAHLSTFNQDYGVVHQIQKSKFNAFIHGGALIVSDNITGTSSIKDKLLSIPAIGERMDIVTINQYSLAGGNNGNLLVLSNGAGVNHHTDRYKTLTLMLMNKDKIVDVIPNDRNNNTNEMLDATIHYMKNKKSKLQFRTLVARNVDRMYGMGDGWFFVIPFEKDNSIHTQTLEILKVHFAEGLNDTLRDKYFYNLLMNTDGTLQDDVLMEWFRKCSATAKSDDEKLRDAYQALKDGLVREYQDIEKYLAANNFSDKKPVPAIRLEEEFKKSPLNKLGFEFKVETITNINYTRLDRAVENRYISFKYMIPWIDRRGEKGMVMGNMPLVKFYDKASNTVVLNSNKVIQEHIERMVR